MEIKVIHASVSELERLIQEAVDAGFVNIRNVFSHTGQIVAVLDKPAAV